MNTGTSRTELKAIFGTEKPIIGALHFAPLLGYRQFKGFRYVLNLAKRDLHSFEHGGVDGVIIENNYDNPPKTFVDPESTSTMTYLGLELKKRAEVPMGVSVLWNDYRAALAIAKVIGARFVRVPVFVDSVQTDFDTIYAEPKKVIAYRKALDAENILIFADVHVKHSQILNRDSVTQSARKATRAGADTIIITGKWTGNAPPVTVLDAARKGSGVPILIGSGLDAANAPELLEHADGAIVSTALKKGDPVPGERQVKPYTARIDAARVARLMQAVRAARKTGQKRGRYPAIEKIV